MDRGTFAGYGSTQSHVGPRFCEGRGVSPTIVARDGRPVLITGSPGGRTIINTVVCVLTNVLHYELPLREAIDAPRLHHQWFPDLVRFEGQGNAEYSAALAELRRLGHAIDPQSGRQGSANSIWIAPAGGVLHGAADVRRPVATAAGE